MNSYIQISAVILLLFAGCAESKTEENVYSSTNFSKDSLVLDSLLSEKIPDFSGRILVAKNMKKVYDRSFGYADRDIKVLYSPETANGIASLSKQFVASLIMDLYEDGLLTPEDSLGTYFADLTSDKAEITIHQLLTHTSGLPRYSGRDADPVSKEDFYNWFKNTALDYQPGEQYAYSNPGYTLLLLIAEEITRKKFMPLLRERFFKKLNMTSTGYREPDNPLAVNYDGDTRIGTAAELPWAPDGPYWNLRGGGGIISTLDDLFIWFKAIYNNQLFNKNTTEMLFTPYVETGIEGDHYGYGWHIVEDETLGTYIDHSGTDGVKFTDLRYFKEHGVLLIMTTNSFRIEEIRNILRSVETAFKLKK